MTWNLPIGVFDSGVGGLTVVRSLMRQLPRERVVYFGDTARVPYGIKGEDTIRRYAAQIVRFLMAQDIKLLIVACNTMAAVALDRIVEEAGKVPVIDVITAGAEHAASRNDGRPIGVIGTTATIRSGAYERAIRRLRPDAAVRSAACPLLVPLVEEGWFDHPATRLVAEEYLAPLKRAGVDTLVLGCTHYPLLKGLLHEVMGGEVSLIDSAEETARSLAEALDEAGMASGTTVPGRHRFVVSDDQARFLQVGARFLGDRLGEPELVRLG